MTDPIVHPTPNNQFPVPDIGLPNWGDEIQNCITMIDALLGAVASIGNYDSVIRPGIAQMVGDDPLGTASKTLIGAVNELLTGYGNLQDLLIDANIKDVTLVPDGAVFLTINITGVTVASADPQVAPQTAAGIGILRYYNATKTLTFQPFGGTEDMHIDVSAGGASILIGNADGPDDQGGIYVDVDETLLPMTDQQDNVNVYTSSVVVNGIIGTVPGYGLDVPLVFIKTNGQSAPTDLSWHFGRLPITGNIYTAGKLTAQNNVPTVGKCTITTDLPSGFGGSSAAVFWCTDPIQVTSLVAFLAFSNAVLHDLALFYNNGLKTTVFANAATSFVAAVNAVQASLTNFENKVRTGRVVVDNADTVTVAFTVPFADDSYSISCLPDIDISFWVTSRSMMGFIISFPSTTTCYLDWTAIHD